MKPITTENIASIDLKNLPKGANIITEDGKPVAIIMSVEYYSYILNTIKNVNNIIKNDNSHT